MGKLSRSASFQDGTRRHAFLGAVLWTSAVTASLVAAAVATMTALMPISLGWGEAIAAGADPWLAALVTGLEFAGVAAASALGIVLWHTRRFRLVAPLLVFGAMLATLWLAARFVVEYT